MKRVEHEFPGQRKAKHYFPVNSNDPLLAGLRPEPQITSNYIAGIDQILVDIEAKVDDLLINKYQLVKGSSTLIDDQTADRLYQ